MSQPKVSVIVITYNQEDTIGQCLDSIIAQECTFEIEILVGEDCSTDRTLEVCRTYAARHPQIRLFAHSKNKGIVDNYFDLILEAKGEYLADCAGDDYWIDSKKLQKQIDILDAHPQISLVHTNWREQITTTGALLPHARRCTIGTDFITSGSDFTPFLPVQIAEIAIHLCTACYRRSSFLEFYHSYIDLFRGDDLPCEDLQIAYALCCKGAIAFINEDTLSYRVHPQSLTNSQNQKRRFRFAKQLVLLTHRFDRLFEVDKQLLSGYYNVRLLELTRFALRIDSPEIIAEIEGLLQTIGYRPAGKTKLYWYCVRYTPTRKILKHLRNLYLIIKGNE